MAEHDIDVDDEAVFGSYIKETFKTLKSHTQEYEMEYNGVGISKMPDDRLMQSFDDVKREVERRGLQTLTYKQINAIIDARNTLRELGRTNRLKDAFPSIF